MLFDFGVGGGVINFNLFGGFCFLTDRQTDWLTDKWTNKQTLEILELLFVTICIFNLRYILNELRTKEGVNGHWAPIWRLCPVCHLNFTVYARTENILEDEKYYKKLSKLRHKNLTEGDGIDHGNQRKINKCRIIISISYITITGSC